MACGVVEESLPIMEIRRATDLFTFEQDTVRRAPAADPTWLSRSIQRDAACVRRVGFGA